MIKTEVYITEDGSVFHNHSKALVHADKVYNEMLMLLAVELIPTNSREGMAEAIHNRLNKLRMILRAKDDMQLKENNV